MTSRESSITVPIFFAQRDATFAISIANWKSKVASSGISGLTYKGKLTALSVGSVYAGTLWINPSLFQRYHLSRETITLIPTFFVGEFNNDQTKIVASAVVTAIPEVVAYLGLRSGAGTCGATSTRAARPKR